MRTKLEDRETSETFVVKSSSPHPWEMIIHPFKAVRFMSALGRDGRVSLLRKVLYIVPILVLVVALLLPETIIADVVALALPVVGPIVDIPADGVLDWAFIGLAAYALLGILPQAIVREQHTRVFHSGRMARQSRRRPL
jgi:hypothetical protein